MNCPKCGSLLIIDTIIDMGYVIIAHCPNCNFNNHPELSNKNGGIVWKS